MYSLKFCQDFVDSKQSDGSYIDPRTGQTLNPRVHGPLIDLYRRQCNKYTNVDLGEIKYNRRYQRSTGRPTIKSNPRSRGRESSSSRRSPSPTPTIRKTPRPTISSRVVKSIRERIVELIDQYDEDQELDMDQLIQLAREVDREKLLEKAKERWLQLSKTDQNSVLEAINSAYDRIRSEYQMVENRYRQSPGGTRYTPGGSRVYVSPGRLSSGSVSPRSVSPRSVSPTGTPYTPSMRKWSDQEMEQAEDVELDPRRLVSSKIERMSNGSPSTYGTPTTTTPGRQSRYYMTTRRASPSPTRRSLSPRSVSSVVTPTMESWAEQEMEQAAEVKLSPERLLNSRQQEKAGLSVSSKSSTSNRTSQERQRTSQERQRMSQRTSQERQRKSQERQRMSQGRSMMPILRSNRIMQPRS